MCPRNQSRRLGSTPRRVVDSAPPERSAAASNVVASPKGARQVCSWGFNRYAFSICAASALLAGCGGSQPPIGASAASTQDVTPSGHQRFDYTGQRQTFTVPTNVTWLTVDALGASGASGEFLPRIGIEGPNGGRVYAVIPVTPGEKLAVFVGGEGSEMSGGFNGGGNGGGASYDCYCYGYGGGGASDIRRGGDRLRDRVLVVGGGGGQGGRGSNSSSHGGGGGEGGASIGGAGDTGGNNNAGGGGAGGRQHRGGSGGSAGVAAGSFDCSGSSGDVGSLGQGGDGGAGCSEEYSYGAGGGGGGGGYYGAGGAGGGSAVITAVNQAVAAAADRPTSSPARSAFKLGRDGKRPRAPVLSS